MKTILKIMQCNSIYIYRQCMNVNNIIADMKASCRQKPASTCLRTYGRSISMKVTEGRDFKMSRCCLSKEAAFFSWGLVGLVMVLHLLQFRVRLLATAQLLSRLVGKVAEATISKSATVPSQEKNTRPAANVRMTIAAKCWNLLTACGNPTLDIS